ncbi:MAG: metal ABC transporter permease [Firmicutes bacterium]|jgi:zinc/manganese transport system permease protein|nr:metal ABC transporter permease [Bacillota bacterium]
MNILHDIVEPGFFSSSVIDTALVIGCLTAIVSAVAGTFTVLRSQSFIGHALSDIGATGGAAAYLVGVPTIYGFVAINLAIGVFLDALGINNKKERDIVTGVVLGASLGLTALFLYLDTTNTSGSGDTMNLLFGSILTIQPSLINVFIVLSALSIALLIVYYRQLLLSSIDTDLLQAKRRSPKAASLVFLLALALAVSMSAIAIGAILSTALLVGPATAATRLAKDMKSTFIYASLIGGVSIFLGLLLSYDSYTWPPYHHGWPVSFFVVAVIFIIYLLTLLKPEAKTRYKAGQV